MADKLELRSSARVISANPVSGSCFSEPGSRAKKKVKLRNIRFFCMWEGD